MDRRRHPRITPATLRCLPALLALLAGMPTMPAAAAVLVTFDGRTSQFTPGPLPALASLTGSFTIDDGVLPSGGGASTFDGALDAFSVTIAGQTFGGTNGRYQQLTSANGVNGFITGRLGPLGSSTFGSTFGTWHDGTTLWTFVGMDFDFRGLAADFFPGGDPDRIGGGFGRSDDGNTDNDEITFALMTLRFVDAATGQVDNASQRVGFQRIDFGAAQAVPAPPLPGLLALALALLAGARARWAALRRWPRRRTSTILRAPNHRCEHHDGRVPV